MDEFKNQIWEVINAINQDWVDALKAADESGEGVDLSEMFGKFSAHMKDLNQKITEFQQRNKKKGKFW